MTKVLTAAAAAARETKVTPPMTHEHQDEEVQ